MTIPRLLLTLTLLLVPATLLAQTAPPPQPLPAIPYSPSLDLSSLDRTIDPCTDIYYQLPRRRPPAPAL